MKKSSAKESKPPGVRSGRPASAWRDKSVQELAADQGIKIPQDKRGLLGACADLWDSDEEFEEFLKGIYDRRHAPPGGRPSAR